MRFVGELSNLGVGPERKRRATASNVAPKKGDAGKTQSFKVRNVEKKGMRHSSDKCDYVVVSDTLEGLAPAVTIRRPKPEPKDSANIPPSNPEDTIDLESSPEHLVQRGASKRKQTDTDAEGQPPKKVQRKKITRKGNLDAFVSESVPGKWRLSLFSLCGLDPYGFLFFQKFLLLLFPQNCNLW